MTKGLKVADGDRIGKTIVFAKNHEHAVFIEERFNANYPHLKGHFARVIDFKTEYSQSLIDDFSTPEKSPHIAISVDMLDTGIDVPEVANLVFFKIVRSPSKFWQMIGRGTRLSPDLFGPGEHKEFFYVFDFCQNFEFFKQNPQVTDGGGGASLSEKLFTRRLELIGELENRSKVTVSPELLEVQSDFTEHIQDTVFKMNLDNFIVRQKRQIVEKYQDANIWDRLTPEHRQELVKELAALPSKKLDGDDDLAAKQFDLLVFNTEISLMKGQKSFKGYRKKITELASFLEELSNVPAISTELELIQEIQTDDYWQDITVPILESARKRLRSLIKLIEIKKRPHIYTDFQDEIGTAMEVELSQLSSGVDLYKFRLRVKVFLKEHENHLTIHKIKKNEPLTQLDLNEIEKIFLENGVAQPDDLTRVREEGGLGLFIRSLVGLDREAAKTLFQDFLQGLPQPPTADQTEFVNMIIDHLTQNGIMEPSCLYESPFTDIDSLGVVGVFPRESNINELIVILEDVKRRAMI